MNATARSDERWAKTFAQVKYWAWKILTLIFIGPIYVTVVSDGLAYLVPPLGQRISRIPMLSFLSDFEATYRLKLAFPFSVLLLIAVWWLWDRLLGLWLGDRPETYGLNPESYTKLITVLGVVILGADSCLFFISMTQSTWGGSNFSFSALLSTAAYVAVLVFISFMSCVLRRSTSKS